MVLDKPANISYAEAVRELKEAVRKEAFEFEISTREPSQEISYLKQTLKSMPMILLTRSGASFGNLLALDVLPRVLPYCSSA